MAATEDAARTSNMLGRTHQRAQEGTRRGGKSRGGGQASGGSLRACIRVPPSRSASPTQGLPSPFFCTRGDARTPDCSARRASSGAPGRARREVSTRLRRCMRAGVEVCSTWHGFPPPPTRSHVPYTQSTRRELRAVRHTVSTEACFSTWGMRRGRGGGARGRVGHAQREGRGENPPRASATDVCRGTHRPGAQCAAACGGHVRRRSLLASAWRSHWQAVPAAGPRPAASPAHAAAAGP